MERMSDPLKGAGKIGFFAEQFLKAYFRYGKGDRVTKGRTAASGDESKPNLFDFEQDLLRCWHVCDDLKTLARAMLDNPGSMSKDEVANIIIGLDVLYDYQFRQLIDDFEMLVEQEKFQ